MGRTATPVSTPTWRNSTSNTSLRPTVQCPKRPHAERTEPCRATLRLSDYVHAPMLASPHRPRIRSVGTVPAVPGTARSASARGSAARRRRPLGSLRSLATVASQGPAAQAVESGLEPVRSLDAERRPGRDGEIVTHLPAVDRHSSKSAGPRRLDRRPDSSSPGA